MYLNMNIRHFLSLPVNDGWSFIDGSGCGCLKGNFVRSFNHSATETDIIGGMVQLAIIDTRLTAILNRCEAIHMGGSASSHTSLCVCFFKLAEKGATGRPQYAKLALIRMLRRFGYLPQELKSNITQSNKELVTV